MTDYEKQRLMRMQENKAKMDELGVKSLAYEAMCMKNQKRQKVSKVMSKRVFANNDQYRPEEVCLPNQSSKENCNGSMQMRRSLRFPSNKVIATTTTTGGNLAKRVERPRLSTNAMVMEERGGNLIKSKTLAKKGKGKTIAPGSLGAYVRMRERLKEKELLSASDVLKETVQERPMEESSWKQQASYSQMQEFGLLDDEGFESADDYAFEEENEAVENINESIPIQDQQNVQLVPQKKMTRGPSMCKDVHGWTINERKPIILNAKGEPIGPDDKTLDKFNRFLGSLSRDSTLAPLNRLNWHHVTGKDNIWDYVKMKFMIADRGKEYVLKKIGELWRTHKSRTKKKHL